MQSNFLNFMQATFFTDSKCCTNPKKAPKYRRYGFSRQDIEQIISVGKNLTTKVEDAFQMKNKGRIKCPPQVSNPLYPTSEAYALSSEPL